MDGKFLIFLQLPMNLCRQRSSAVSDSEMDHKHMAQYVEEKGVALDSLTWLLKHKNCELGTLVSVELYLKLRTHVQWPMNVFKNLRLS